MKLKIFIFAVLTGLIFIAITSCSKTNPLNTQLDELEKIIIKYEPKFNSIEYGSKEYTEMIAKYNEEIYAWAEVFEKGRYNRDANGKVLFDKANKPIINEKFNKDVEKRFYELNDRMSRMVLATIPKSEKPTEPSQPQPN